MAKPGKIKDKTLHVEIMQANWTRMKDYINAYNNSPGRITPKIKNGDIINEALVRYFKAKNS